MATATGVINPKNIIPTTIGLTTVPKISPNRIQILLRGERASLLVIVVSKNMEAKTKKNKPQYVSVENQK